MFDREIYFNNVRASLFSGSLSQSQVNGQEALLAAWEAKPTSDDLRHFAYMLATTFHETDKKMQPIEEYGKGGGHDYGKPDPTTGQTYYGRGFVQLTWADNYKRATEKLGLTDNDDLYRHAARALDPTIASNVMFRGMSEGWFTGKKLGSYFSPSANDPVGARIIINNDVSKNGQMIAGYHDKFLAALKAAWREPEADVKLVMVDIYQPPGVQISIKVNGVPVDVA